MALQQLLFSHLEEDKKEEPLYLGSEISVEYPKEASKSKNWREDKQEIRSKIVRECEVNTIFLRHDQSTAGCSVIRIEVHKRLY